MLFMLLGAADAFYAFWVRMKSDRFHLVAQPCGSQTMPSKAIASILDGSILLHARLEYSNLIAVHSSILNTLTFFGRNFPRKMLAGSQVVRPLASVPMWLTHGNRRNSTLKKTCLELFGDLPCQPLYC